jgi:adenine specific DNA methylase Mod
MNQLFYGDNLNVMRGSLKNESVDLVYLDPPFNSKRDYNLLFKSPKGHESEAQITAFEDSWHWGEQAEREYDELIHSLNTDLAEVMQSLRRFLGENDMMAYLTMMSNRILELHRVLKPTGSLYLHCDPTASHYLKIVLDGVFGKENFSNEIIWKRTTTKNDYKQGAVNWPRVHDVILMYHRSTDAAREAGKFHQPFEAYEEKTIETFYNFKDADGRRYRLSDLTAPGQGSRGHPQYEFKGVTRYWRYNKEKMEKLDAEGRIQFRPHGGVPRLKVYLDDAPGIATGDVWVDVRGMHNLGTEMLGYPTQKPLALLERIIQASSNEGDVVLDPFCGCGTAVHAAQKLNRTWIGIDITHLAISLIEKRLKNAFGAACVFEVHGTPKDLDSAADLARRDKYQFQWWAVSLVDAQPFQGKKKGADTGIDGLKFFRDIDKKEARKIVVSVKGGGIKADDVRALNHVREREGAEIALFVTLGEPTRGMAGDAASAGFYESPNGKKFARVQLLTIDGLLSKRQRAEHPDYEPDLNFKKPKGESMSKQQGLEL